MKRFLITLGTCASALTLGVGIASAADLNTDLQTAVEGNDGSGSLVSVDAPVTALSDTSDRGDADGDKALIQVNAPVTVASETDDSPTVH